MTTQRMKSKPGESPESHRRKVERWNHNSLFGAVGMIRSNAQRVLRAETASSSAKELATLIEQYADMLRDSLKTRIERDEEGKLREVRPRNPDSPSI